MFYSSTAACSYEVCIWSMSTAKDMQQDRIAGYRSNTANCVPGLASPQVMEHRTFLSIVIYRYILLFNKYRIPGSRSDTAKGVFMF